MKKKFNLKLTIFLVSLFVSLMIVVLGNQIKGCLCFGFVLMGISLCLFVWYNNEKVVQTIDSINEQIDDIQNDKTEQELDDQEKTYALSELFKRQHRIAKHSKKVRLVFYLCGVLLVLLGILSII